MNGKWELNCLRFLKDSSSVQSRMSSHRTAKPQNYRLIRLCSKGSPKSHRYHQRPWHITHRNTETKVTRAWKLVSLGQRYFRNRRSDIYLWMWCNRKTLHRFVNLVEAIDSWILPKMVRKCDSIHGRRWCCFDKINLRFWGPSWIRITATDGAGIQGEWFADWKYWGWIDLLGHWSSLEINRADQTQTLHSIWQ